MPGKTNCNRITKCPFFSAQMKNKPQSVQLFKEYYCLDRYTECARFFVGAMLGSENVPSDLYPNDLGRGRALVNEEDTPI